MNIHSLIEVLVIGIASNLDNAGVGISYGVRKVHISWFANLIVALLSFGMTLVSGLAGNYLSVYLTPFIGQMIGTFVIIGVGIVVLFQPFLKSRPDKESSKNHILTRILRNPEEADLDHSKSISFVEAIILGIALGLNALAGGFDAGMVHLNVWATSLSVGLFSFTLLGITEYIGRTYIAGKLGTKATLLSGMLLIIVGLHQLF